MGGNRKFALGQVVMTATAMRVLNLQDIRQVVSSSKANLQDALGTVTHFQGMDDNVIRYAFIEEDEQINAMDFMARHRDNNQVTWFIITEYDKSTTIIAV